LRLERLNESRKEVVQNVPLFSILRNRPAIGVRDISLEEANLLRRLWEVFNEVIWFLWTATTRSAQSRSCGVTGLEYSFEISIPSSAITVTAFSATGLPG